MQVATLNRPHSSTAGPTAPPRRPHSTPHRLRRPSTYIEAPEASATCLEGGYPGFFRLKPARHAGPIPCPRWPPAVDQPGPAREDLAARFRLAAWTGRAGGQKRPHRIVGFSSAAKHLAWLTLLENLGASGPAAQPAPSAAVGGVGRRRSTEGDPPSCGYHAAPATPRYHDKPAGGAHEEEIRQPPPRGFPGFRRSESGPASTTSPASTSSTGTSGRRRANDSPPQRQTTITGPRLLREEPCSRNPACRLCSISRAGNEFRGSAQRLYRPSTGISNSNVSRPCCREGRAGWVHVGFHGFGKTRWPWARDPLHRQRFLDGWNGR